MLAGENFGRGHHTGLISVVDSQQHAHKRDECLSAAYIALKQTVHLMSRDRIGTYLFNYSLLCLGQFERQVSVVKFVELLAYTTENESCFTADTAFALNTVFPVTPHWPRQ